MNLKSGKVGLNLLCLLFVSSKPVHHQYPRLFFSSFQINYTNQTRHKRSLLFLPKRHLSIVVSSIPWITRLQRSVVSELFTTTSPPPLMTLPPTSDLTPPPASFIPVLPPSHDCSYCTYLTSLERG